MSWTKPRIEKLTVAEQKMLPSFYEKWQRIALCTEPADRAAAEDGAVLLYRTFDLKSPTEFVWAKSLWEAYEQSKTADDDFVHKIGVNLWNRAFNELRRDFTVPLLRLVLRGDRDYVVELWSPERLLETAGKRIERRLEDRSYHLCYGQDDAEWLAVTEFFATIGVEFCKKLAPLRQVVAACGFVWFSPSKVVFVDRPKTLRLDDRRHLHCFDGPAIKYGDNDEAYAIHGIPVPKKYVETPAEEIDLTEVLKETNAEIRMAVISKIGFSRLLETMKPKSSKFIKQTCPKCGEHIDITLPKRIRGGRSPLTLVSQANGNSLFEINLGPGGWRNNQLVRFLHLTWRDKTGLKETVLPVPRIKHQFGPDCPENVNDCEQVRRWTLGWPKEALAVAET